LKRGYIVILTVGNTKGGVGKSTLAVQLALGLSLDGKKVWLVDGDRQATSLGAITVRAENGRTPIAASAYSDGATLRAQITQQREDYEHIIIDAGGRDSTALRAALTISDVVLVPFQPRSFDVWALSDIGSLLNEARAVRDVRAFAMLNAADSQGTDNKEAAEALIDVPGIELLPVQVNRRKAIASASGAGLYIDEYRPRDGAASSELGAVKKILFQY
jgi:chromosome partitioning protein